MKRIFFFLVAWFTLNTLLAQIPDACKTNLSNGFYSSLAKQQYRTNSTVEDTYDVRFYFLDINLERTSVAISGSVHIDASVKSATLDTMALDMSDTLRVDSILVNNKKCTYTKGNNKLLILLGDALPIHNLFRATIYYHGTPQSVGFFSGISNANSVTWTLSESYNAYQWWPCKQELNDKADSAWIFITTDASNKAGSNGTLTRITDMPNNKKRYEWKTKHAINYYLISAAVSNYIDYSLYAHIPNSSDSILIQNYIYNANTLTNYKTDIDQTADFLILFSQLYGMYPYKDEKYGHCMAPIPGGMEHQTMTTQGWFDFYLTSHELSHQWFGNLVTCATWQDIWVNESWAAYSEYLAAQYLKNISTANSHMETVHTNVMSSSGGSIYIPFEQIGDENRIFDQRLSYDKGAAVIHMLRYELQNDSSFFHIIRQFLDTYKDSVATIADFKHVAESYTGRDYTDFFNQWIYGEGYPLYNLVWSQTGSTVTIHSTQSTSTTATPLFKMRYDCKLQSAQGDTVVVLYQQQKTQDFTFTTSKKISGIVLDPNNWQLMKVNSIALGTHEIMEESSFQIYPNPANEVINVKNMTNLNSYVYICDITGKILMHSLIGNGNHAIDISNLTDGVYLLKVETEVGVMVKKWVKYSM